MNGPYGSLAPSRGGSRGASNERKSTGPERERHTHHSIITKCFLRDHNAYSMTLRSPRCEGQHCPVCIQRTLTHITEGQLGSLV